MITKILGLDISSTCIGYGVLEINQLTKEIKYLESGFIKPDKKGSILDRIINTREKMSQIINKIQPDEIAIEELIKFMPKSTATTVVILTTFNQMICLLAYDYLKKLPTLLNVLTIRHGLKISKKLPKKKEMPELIATHLGINFPYEKFIRGKKKNNIKIESYDVADGLAVALYQALLLTNKIKKRKK